MNRNNFWRFVIVVLVLTWAVISFWPPTSRDLIQTFREKAVRPDTNFHAIVERAMELQRKIPEKPYDNLKQAIGTNDINRYFPFFGVTNDNHPTITILNRLQRDAAGKIRLGIDLQGGTSFVVGMQTNSLPPGTDVSGALSEAVEVLRKRVDRFGVAEPIIQTEGSDRILVMLPGLSAAEQEEAKTAIQKPAFLALRMVHERSDEDIKDGIVQPGYEILKRVDRRADGRELTEIVEVRKTPEMTGSGIKNAQVVRGNLGEPEIQFTLDA
jgi:SecD/SecF fusion protein